MNQISASVPARFAALLLLVWGSAAGWSSAADKVFLKSGEMLEGTIIEETDAGVKIQVATGTIKETKTVTKAEIDRIERPTPDDLAFEQIQKLVPTPSLLKESDYRQRLQSGPEAFLTDYPLSKHKEAVEKIRDELSAELDKVKEGSIKLNGEWISAVDQKAHRENIDAQITLARIKQLGRTGNFLPALRGVERMKKDFPKTRAYAESIGVKKSLIQGYGKSLSRRLQDRRAYDSTLEQRKERLTEAQVQQVERAAAQAEAKVEALNEKEKAAGIKWRTVNTESVASLEKAIEFLKKELLSMEKVKVDAIKAETDALYEVESLLADGKLEEAESKLRLSMGSRGKSRNLSSRDPHLSRVIMDLKLAKEDKEKAAALEEIERAKELAASKPAATLEVASAEGNTSAEDALAALMAERPSSATETKDAGKEEAKDEKPERKAPPRTTTASTSSGGGISLGVIMPIVLVLLLGGTGLAYFLDKKKKAQGGMEE